jgi:hypothetical protein
MREANAHSDKLEWDKVLKDFDADEPAMAGSSAEIWD